MKNLILISGKKQCGKSTLAELFFKKKYYYSALADELKLHVDRWLYECFDICPSWVFGNNEEKDRSLGIKMSDGTEFTSRKALQEYGQFIKKVFGNYYWCEQIEKQLKDEYETESNQVISDVRFVYELEYLSTVLLKCYNIYTIRIKRDTGLEDNDISETHMDDYPDENFDFVIDNNGTLDDLKDRFEEIYKYIT
jgi:dephospho-CoA kinase